MKWNCSILRRGRELPESQAGPLWRVSITTTPEASDAVAELLGAIFGKSPVSYRNFETGTTTITVYCPQKQACQTGQREKIHAGLKHIKQCGLKPGPGKITIAKVLREDWAESWKRHFKPIEIKPVRRKDKSRKFLLIKPSWSKRKPGGNQAVVVLDPGLSFGTGQHPTTAFCLQELVNRREKGRTQSFLDLGTGSGILAIAAVKLGYSPVHALDFDPDAVRIARANARANRVHQKLKISRGDVTKLPVRGGRRYDLICANLVSTLLITERRRIAAQLDRGGTLVLAGILKPEFVQIQSAFEALGLKLVSSRTEKEWRSGLFCLRP